MIWVGQAEAAPNFSDHEMPDPDKIKINRLGSWSGRMTQSNHQSSPDITPTQGDLKTANFFGKRIVEITKKFKG
ncbi:transcriptional regulator [Rickettsia conorii]|uniref:transcriptional regulator n=1 Tax=Rickettsia conorii TaxID=781 RepID=UPI002260D285|nr:transcriptional regulator [Rickettsia conorii]UZW38286.1 transcriptional regulator [Rickettsia conorii subsp. heilongjiangensis]